MRAALHMACTSIGAAFLVFLVLQIILYLFGDRASDMACGAIIGGAIVSGFSVTRTDARKSGAPQ